MKDKTLPKSLGYSNAICPTALLKGSMFLAAHASLHTRSVHTHRYGMLYCSGRLHCHGQVAFAQSYKRNEVNDGQVILPLRSTTHFGRATTAPCLRLVFWHYFTARLHHSFGKLGLPCNDSESRPGARTTRRAEDLAQADSFLEVSDCLSSRSWLAEIQAAATFRGERLQLCQGDTCC